MEFRLFLDQLRSGDDTEVVDEPAGCADFPGRVVAAENRDNRVVLFEDIAGASGQVVGNLFGSQDRINQSMGTADTASLHEQFDRATAEPVPIRTTSEDAQECGYEIVENPNILKHLPPIVHSQHDSTPYLTSGVVLARNPDTGKHHVCFIRMSVQDGNVVLFNPQTPRIKEIVAKTVGKGSPLDVAILIGAPTEVMLLGALSFTSETDELEVAQALGGDSLRFIERGLPVPDTTEMILWGRVMPDYRPEGPFGELTGAYSTHSDPICVIDELWERQGFVYHSILGGVSREHVALVSLKAQNEMERLKRETPRVVDYRLPRFAAGKLAMVVVEDGTAMDEVVRDLSDVPLVKLFILLNKDTDPGFSDDVLWALTQRSGAEGDIAIIDEDPARGLARRTVIDATVDDPSAWSSVRVEVYG